MSSDERRGNSMMAAFKVEERYLTKLSTSVFLNECPCFPIFFKRGCT